MICGSVRLLNVCVTHLQRNQCGDPDSCRSRFEGSVLAPVSPNGAGWSHLLLTSAKTSQRDTHHKNSLLQKMLYQVCEHGSWPTLRIYPGVTTTSEIQSQGAYCSSCILKIGNQACSTSICACLALAACVPSSRCTITIFSLSTPLHQMHAAL